jgi:hypothetical protein
MNVNIVEILSRSTQGATRPFLCRGDDGFLYYVKGRGAGNKALISEWIAGNIARRIGLPVPEFRFAAIPKEIMDFSARDDISDLGSGVGFGSRLIENADELSYLFTEQIDIQLRSKILFFDWWIANADRTLTENGGNPNILWVHNSQKPYVIDHNLAFDLTALPDFWDHHIFAITRPTWTSSFRSEMESLSCAILNELDTWWNEMPAMWTGMETVISLDLVRSLLWRFQTEPINFWGSL